MSDEFKSNVVHLPKPPSHRSPMGIPDHLEAAGITNAMVLGFDSTGAFLFMKSGKVSPERALYLLELAKADIVGWIG